MTDRGPAGADFVQLDLKTTALLFDVDGTLIDIAPRPDAVVVPDDLRQSLALLAKATDGALALVSGRPIADLDRLVAPLLLPAIGGHGAEMRRTPGQAVEASAPLPEALRRELAAARAIDPGILIEDKGYSLALHYRVAPQAQTRLRRHIDSVCAKFPGEALEVLLGKALFEVKRPGISKGEAVGRLMAGAPFAGRRPGFVGDDVTDESVFAQLPALGGMGFAVGRPFDGVTGIFGSPAELRRALAALAATI